MVKSIQKLQKNAILWLFISKIFFLHKWPPKTPLQLLQWNPAYVDNLAAVKYYFESTSRSCDCPSWSLPQHFEKAETQAGMVIFPSPFHSSMEAWKEKLNSKAVSFTTHVKTRNSSHSCSEECRCRNLDWKGGRWRQGTSEIWKKIGALRVSSCLLWVFMMCFRSVAASVTTWICQVFEPGTTFETHDKWQGKMKNDKGKWQMTRENGKQRCHAFLWSLVSCQKNGLKWPFGAQMA